MESLKKLFVVDTKHTHTQKESSEILFDEHERNKNRKKKQRKRNGEMGKIFFFLLCSIIICMKHKKKYENKNIKE